MSIRFVPHRFRRAAGHDVRGRLSYPPALISRVVSLTGLTTQDRVLGEAQDRRSNWREKMEEPELACFQRMPGFVRLNVAERGCDEGGALL